MSHLPYLINFPKIGDSQLGFISVLENENLPFIPRRIYWTYSTPEDVLRGHHAHFELEQILVAVSGIVEVKIIMQNGLEFNFILDKPQVGLFIPKMCWRTMKYKNDVVQVCIASMEYKESDYIREYNDFLKYKND